MILLIVKQSRISRAESALATILIQIMSIFYLNRVTVVCVGVTPTEQTVIKISTENEKLIRENHVKFNEISNRCDSAEVDLDRCSARLIALGQSELVYPMTMNELNSVYCSNFKSTVSCIKNNTECYKPFEKQIINWILSSSRRMNYKRCKNESEKQKFLRLTQSCFSVMKNPMDKCMNNYVANLEAIASFNDPIERASEDDIQIQLSCCANKRFKDCVMRNAKRNCKPIDSLRKLRRTNSVSSQRVAQKHFELSALSMMQDLKSTLNSMALTGPELICESVDEKFCQINFDGRYRGGIAKHKSIVPAMIKIYSNK